MSYRSHNSKLPNRKRRSLAVARSLDYPRRSLRSRLRKKIVPYLFCVTSFSFNSISFIRRIGIKMVDEKAIKAAQEKFGELLRKQLERVDVLKGEGDWIDYSKLDKLIIGVCGGDGIGPYICASAQRVMEFLLADKIKAGKVEIRQIDGLTIERRVEVMKAIPDDTLEELKKCHVILKGPTTTPKKLSLIHI